jgi:hypothetical protein
MTEEGIVESSPATVIKRSRVDFEIEAPIIGSDTGDDLGTQVSRVSGVHRSKYVTHDGDVIKEYDDELDYQELTPLKGSATENVIKQKEAEEQKSLFQKVANWLHRDHIALQEKVTKAQEDDARRNYESKVVKLGDDPGELTQDTYDKYLSQREIDQRTATYMQKRDREGKK